VRSGGGRRAVRKLSDPKRERSDDGEKSHDSYQVRPVVFPKRQYSAPEEAHPSLLSTFRDLPTLISTKNVVIKSRNQLSAAAFWWIALLGDAN